MEGEKYKPEDVLQQEGPNKGNIKDESLARVGAEAEDKERSKNLKYGIKGLFEKGRYRTEYEEPKSVAELKAEGGDLAGEKAMAEEVGRRSYQSDQAQYADLKGEPAEFYKANSRMYADLDKKSFDRQQNKLSNERKYEAKKTEDGE